MIAEQYIPSFFCGFKQKKNLFSNTEELLNIEWIKYFANDNEFHRFSLNRDENKYAVKAQHFLMLERKKGFEWWVVAIIRDNNISGIDDLPEWNAKYKDEA